MGCSGRETSVLVIEHSIWIQPRASPTTGVAREAREWGQNNVPLCTEYFGQECQEDLRGKSTHQTVHPHVLEAQPGMFSCHVVWIEQHTYFASMSSFGMCKMDFSRFCAYQGYIHTKCLCSSFHTTWLLCISEASWVVCAPDVDGCGVPIMHECSVWKGLSVLARAMPSQNTLTAPYMLPWALGRSKDEAPVGNYTNQAC